MFTMLSKLERSELRHRPVARRAFGLPKGIHPVSGHLVVLALRQGAQHVPAAPTEVATDASSTACGGVVNTATGPCRAVEVFPGNRLSRHINSYGMFPL